MFSSPIKYNLSEFGTKPRHFNNVYLTLIYGHIYVLLFIYSLVIYEYYKGEISLNMANIDKVFFTDFINYFKLNDLIKLLGLQVLKYNANFNRQILEFVITE